jgi:hypothetical protein
MVMREPIMKGIVQEFYHQHNKYCPHCMMIKNERKNVDAVVTAHRDASLGSLQEQSQPLVEIAR